MLFTYPLCALPWVKWEKPRKHDDKTPAEFPLITSPWSGSLRHYNTPSCGYNRYSFPIAIPQIRHWSCSDNEAWIPLTLV
jgi:hypothetical protein